MKEFNSFFIGGYECADMINNRGNRVDLLKDTAHDVRAEEDYRMLAAIGISTVREGIRWSVVERQPYQFDFSEVEARLQAAKQVGIQQLWDICHFGYPDNLMPTHPQFVDRFVAVCRAFTELYRRHTDAPLIVTPINEISFLSWLSGDVAGTVPFLRGSGGVIKENLCRAAIKGIEAIREIDPEAKVMMVEPLIRIHSQPGQRLGKRLQEYNQGQFEAMDIITGRLRPELGGQPDYMDFAGFNYYYNNQWEHCGRFLCWKTERQRSDFPGWLKAAADRYGKPVVLSETGHFKEDRPLWITQITEDCIEAMRRGVDLQGICLYPVLDRPDWDTQAYIPCGIWGYNEQSKERFVEPESMAALQLAMQAVERFDANRRAAPATTEVLAA